MKVYNYDEFTKEFTGSENAFKDPMDNALYLIPRNATLNEAPSFALGEIPVFNGSDWEIKPDFRGKKQICQSDLKISVIRNIGNLEEGHFLISDDEIEKLQNYEKIANFENGTFSLQDLPNEEIIAKKRKQINHLREMARNDGAALFKGDYFDIDQTSLANILSKKSLAEAFPDRVFHYRSKTNQIHELTASEIIELACVISEKIDEIYEHSWDLKSSLTVDCEVSW